MQKQDCLEIQLFQLETSFLLIRERSQSEIRVRVVSLLDVEIVVDQLEKYLLHLVNLNCCELRQHLGEVVVLKGLIVPNLGCYHKRREKDSLPVSSCYFQVLVLKQPLHVNVANDRHLALHFRRNHDVLTVARDPIGLWQCVFQLPVAKDLLKLLLIAH